MMLMVLFFSFIYLLISSSWELILSSNVLLFLISSLFLSKSIFYLLCKFVYSSFSFSFYFKSFLTYSSTFLSNSKNINNIFYFSKRSHSVTRFLYYSFLFYKALMLRFLDFKKFNFSVNFTIFYVVYSISFQSLLYSF